MSGDFLSDRACTGERKQEEDTAVRLVETVPFRGTEEQQEELRSYIEAHRAEPGSLVPIMQRAQAIYGYLPREVQDFIAEETGQPVSRVYGIATFYAMFKLHPEGRNRISVCLGTACYVKGSGTLLARLQEKLGIAPGECTADGRFSLDDCRCVGACGLAPVIIINGDVYGRVKEDELDGILERYE